MKTRFRQIACMILLLSADGVRADPDGPREIGVRGGFDDAERRADLRQYELYGVYRTPWGWSWAGGWRIAWVANVVAGVQEGEDETGFVGQFGPGLVAGRDGGRLSVDIGSAPTYLSEYIFDRLDLGGNFQFTSHVGVRFDVWRGAGIGYRLQHTSNAGLGDPNPGLDMHLFGIGWRF